MPTLMGGVRKMFDIPDDPIIRNMERTGYPDGKEPAEPRCPVCGALCETIYAYEGSEVVGCDVCLTVKDACDVPECIPQYEQEE